MSAIPSQPEVAVIGAGAAGIGASLALTQLNISHVIIEASNRVGGRAYSESTSLGHLWDHGCHWFHSADINILRKMADKLGHRYRHDDQPGGITTYADGKKPQLRESDNYVWEMLEKTVAVGKSGADISAASLLDAENPSVDLARHWLQLMYSADPAEISTLDAAGYLDTATNYPVEDGYGALVARMATALPVRFGVAAERIVVHPHAVTVETNSGSLEATAAIIAVPARVIETGRLRVVPTPQDQLMQAFVDVPMGWYEKIALGLNQRIISDTEWSFANVIRDDRQPVFFELQPFGRPIAIAHLAGSAIRSLEKEGEASMIGYAVDTLATAFGSDIRKHIGRTATTRWTANQWIGGAYACARPGKAGSRREFPKPIHERVFLAGEHTHQTFNATAHGAYESGFAAATRTAHLLKYSTTNLDCLWLPS